MGGLMYLSAGLVNSSGAYRNVGYTRYDIDFANIFLPEMVRCKGQAT